MPNGTPTYVTRRRSLTLPKRRWHVLGVALLLTLTTVALYAFAKTPEPKRDPYISGAIPLPEIPQPLATTNLNGDGEDLPDLLAGDVAQGDNPTAVATITPAASSGTDALGNPTLTATESGTESASSSEAPGPKTILINGQAIGTGRAEIFSDLTISGPYGPLPRKTPNGRSVFKAYQKPFDAQADKQAVSVIIGGLGINAALTERAIRLLPAEVTLSFAAQSRDLQSWINKAREDGHEVMIEIPMDSDSFNPADPGASLTLKAGQEDENNQHLDRLLSQAQGYFGVINYNGNTFLTRTDSTAAMLSRLSEMGLAFISDGAFLTPSLSALALSVELPYKQGFGLIDPQPDLGLIRSELERLSTQAATGTAPVGIGFAYPETLQAVSEWAATLSNESLQLVPASATIGR